MPSAVIPRVYEHGMLATQAAERIRALEDIRPTVHELPPAV